MAVFTAIATAIVTSLATAGGLFLTAAGALTTLGTIAVGVIATGLAVGTAKLFGIYDMPSGDVRDPGIKIQLPPATDNKVARLYGKNFTGSIIIDAEIKNQNKTMAYAMVISEYSDNDTWTISNIYRGDARLNFGSGTSGHIVQSVTDPNATASTSISGKLRCRVYAGGSEAVNQIFPTTNKVAAYTMFDNWTASNTMEDLVFAIFEIDYDAEEGLAGLGAITYEINNALNEPSNVLLDYLKNDRYGAGVSDALIDTASFNSWYDFATTQVDYTTSANVTAQHDRYQIDGALSMFDTAKTNINKICQSGGAFFTYNGKEGKFGVVPNRAATTAEKANAFIFNDDNIVGSISITSTELYSLYNQIEVEYPSVIQKDQTDVYFADVDPAIKAPNEPDNKLEYRLHMCNDRARVSNLANIDLNQNRINTILEFEADYSAMQVDVGDVVKVTSALYGYTDKLFRCMRTTEKETSDGAITVKVVLLEYDDDVYDNLLTQEDLPTANTGIANWWVSNSNAALTIGNVIIVNDPLAANANVHSPVTGAVVSTTPLANVKNDFGSTYTGGVFINVPIDIPGNTTFNEAKVVAINESAATNVPVTFTQAPSTAGNANSYFNPNTTYNFPINAFSFNKDTPFRMEISLGDTVSGSSSRRFVTGSFQANSISTSNTIDDRDIQPGAAGLHDITVFPHYRIDNANISPVPTTTANIVSVNIRDDYYVVSDASNTTIEKYIGRYSLRGTCFFNGLANTINTGQFTLRTDVTYPGNVAVTQSLTEGTDYTEDISVWLKSGNRIPLLTTVGSPVTESVLTTQGQETQFNQAALSLSENTFGFDVLPTAIYYAIITKGALSYTGDNPLGDRGFAVIYEQTEVNKGDLVIDTTLTYLAED